MNQKVKDGDEFSQVRALNHRGKPLPRLQELTIQAMHEEKQRVEEKIFPPCVFKLVFVYASYQVGRLVENFDSHAETADICFVYDVLADSLCVQILIGSPTMQAKHFHSSITGICCCCRDTAHVRGRRQTRQAT